MFPIFFLLLFNYSCPHFTPPTQLLSSALPSPISHIQSFPSLLFLSMGPLYMFLDDPSPSLPSYPPLPSPQVTFSLFFISMSLVLFCLLVCFVHYIPLISDIIWYLSFTAWLISLSIMLSSSIHAVVKGRSPFFLSVV